MKIKRTLTWLLLTAILLSAAGCAGDDTTETVVETAAVETETETDKYDAAQAIYDALDAPDYGAGDFTIFTRPAVGTSEKEIWVEELTGDAVNDAVYDRNAAVEERFNCTIVMQTGDIVSGTRQAVTSGDTTYKLVFPNLSDAAAMAQQGFLLNYLDYPVLDLERPWWDQGTAGLVINNKVFFMNGDINYLDNDVTYILLFNKDIIVDLGMEEPYDLVRNGEWTIEVFTEMCKNVSTDLDGDGTFTAADMYGHVATNASPKTFFYGSGLKYVYFDEEGVPYLDVDEEKITAVLEKVVDLFTKDNMTLIPSDVAVGKTMFMEDRALFYGEVLSYIVNVREMETPFGVLPLPKFDEMQEDYYTFCANISSTCTIPKSCGDPEAVAAILEGMAIQSYITVTPAYYDIALQRKYTRDDASSEMLDIALANRVYDIGEVYTSIGISDIFNGLALKGSTGYASAYQARAKAAATKLETILEDFLNN